MSFLSKMFKSKQNNTETTPTLEIITDSDIENIEVVEVREVVINTTQEELVAYGIIIGLLSTKIDADRIIMRDRATYCGILLDDNNRKPLARLYLETNKMYIGTFDENRKEKKTEIVSVNDISKLKKQLTAVLSFYGEK